MELIDRNALGIGKCNPDVMLNKAYAAGWNGVINIIQAAAIIDAVPVVHSQWVPRHLSGQELSECQNCKGMTTEHGFTICPFCGAKMDETQA